MYRLFLVATVLVACAAYAQATNAPNKAPDTHVPAILQADRRLDKLLSIQSDVLPLAQVVPEIHKQLGVDIMVQGDMLRRAVVIRQSNRPAKELLTDLGLMLGGTWVKRQDAFLLLTDDVTAGLVKRWKGRQAIAEGQALIRSLTPGQQRTLADGKNVKFNQLLPVQQRLARVIATEAFLEDPQRFPSSVVTGEGFIISKPEIADPPLLSFNAPVVWGDGRIVTARLGEVYLRDLR